MSIARSANKLQTLPETVSGTEYDVLVERIVHGGAGLVRVEGKIGFVEGVLPGEKVRVAVTRDHGSRFDARLLEILQSSSHRVEPLCPLSGTCGGCDLQHIHYDEQVEIKRQIVAEDLGRLGGFSLRPDEIGLETGAPWGYRGRVQLHADPQGVTGFHERSSETVVAVNHCPVALPAINELLAGETAFAPGSRTTVVASDAGVVTDVRAREARITVADMAVDFDPRCFFQSNPALLNRLGEVIRMLLKDLRIERVYDLYAGAGLLAMLALPPIRTASRDLPRRVVCVEPERRNARFIRGNLQRTGLDGDRVEVMTITAERALGKLFRNNAHQSPSGGDEQAVAFLDPPRQGLSPAVRSRLAGSGIGRLLYLSCDSASLARDLKALGTSYAMHSIRLFDFFPQTAHVETLVELVRIDRNEHTNSGNGNGGDGGRREQRK